MRTERPSRTQRWAQSRAAASPASSPSANTITSRIVSGSSDETLKVWDAASGDELLTLRGHDGRVECVAFSPDGNQVVSGSHDMTLKIWDVSRV